MKKKLIYLFLLILIAGPVNAQNWSVKTSRLLTPFFNPQQSGGGIFYQYDKIWVSSKNLTDGNSYEFFISSDTCKQWQKLYLPIPNSSNSCVGSLSLGSRQFGMIGLVTSSTDGFETYDGGYAWKLNSAGSTKRLLLSSKVWFQMGRVSLDSGNNWILYTKPGFDAYTLGRDNIGNVFSAGWNSFCITRDSGRTWTYSTPPLDEASWDMCGYVSCYDSAIYIANEERGSIFTHNQGQCDLFVSRDGGQTFQSYYDARSTGFRLTGTVKAAKRGVVYTASFGGVMMSSDFGRTWKNIGGPPGVLHTYSFDLIDDSTLVALDTLGNVWMCENIPVPKAIGQKPIVQGFSLKNISSCDSALAEISLQHQFCSPLIITEAKFTAITPSCFSMGLSVMPDTLFQNETLTIPIDFNPIKQYGMFSGGVRIRAFYLDEGDTIRVDTTIFFDATSKANGPKLLSSNGYLRFDTVSTCGLPIDTVLTLSNFGCDTLRITSGPGSLPPEFELLPPFSLPITLAPDSSVTVRFRFTPKKKGNFTASPSFIAEQQGLTQTISLTLEGNGIEEGGILSYSPKQFSFASLSICARDSASGFITNIGCDSMTVDASYFGDVDYSGSGLGVAGWIQPGDTTFYNVYLNPSQKGIRKGYIALTSKNNIGTSLDSIPFTVIVLDGTKFLSASQNALDFGSTPLCAERDTTFVLRNTGCDTLWVMGFGVSGMGFGVKDTAFFILPGGSKTIDVHTNKDTTGHITSNSATITITSDADNPISPITLTRSFTYPKPYTVRFAIGNTSGKNQSEVKMHIIADSLPPGLMRLDGTLMIGNTDLLSYVGYESNNQVTFNGTNLTISGTPIASGSDTLATLKYKVYLTNDSTTNISFSNVSFNNGDLDYANCIATVQGGESGRFDYEFVCAEHTIARLLRGEQLRITSINPNPTQGEITISIESPMKQEAELSIYDILGKRVTNEHRQLAKGKNTISFDTKALSRGRYTVSINSNTADVQSAFVKE